MNQNQVCFQFSVRLKISFIFNFNYVYAWVCMEVCTPEYWRPLRSKASNPPEASIKDAYEPPSVGALSHLDPAYPHSSLLSAIFTFFLKKKFSSFELNSNIV